MLRTQRDHELLETLGRKVRMLALEQIASTWWPDSRGSVTQARRRMLQLCEAGSLDRYDVLAHGFLELTKPVITWNMGDPPPDFGAVAWQLNHRWPPVAPRRTVLFMATERTCNLYGGPLTPRRPKPGQVTHDLHVGALYLRLLQADPVSAEAWVGEDTRPKSGFGLKDPDAILEYRDGRPSLVVEFGGRYDRGRVEDFHRDCKKRNRAYELW